MKIQKKFSFPLGKANYQAQIDYNCTPALKKPNHLLFQWSCGLTQFWPLSLILIALKKVFLT